MAEPLTRTMVRQLLPHRPHDGHKGTFGHVFIVGGSRGFTGAVKLASLAAARSGVGLVTAGVPRPLGDVLASSLLEVMTYMLDATPAESVAHEALEPALAFARDKDAVVIGPGLSRHPSTCAFVLEFVAKCPVPLLADADALNALSTSLDNLRRRETPLVVTPHPGEMSRLTGLSVETIQQARQATAEDFAKRFKCIVVLKGYETVVSDGHETYLNATGNSGLATGGTGDVLSGIIGGLMAQGLHPFDASRLGVYFHGLTGDLAAQRMGERALIAGDLLGCFPEAWRAIEAADTP